MKEVEIVDGPRVDIRDETPTLGVRDTVPFRTMLSHRDRLLAELIAWMAAHDIEPEGSFFLRLHVVDMPGMMAIEVGVVSGAAAAGDRVVSGVMPAGTYAVLDYRKTSMGANGLLRNWVNAQGLSLDVRETSDGEAFAGRFEIYVTDPRTERMKTRWIVQLAFLLR